MTVCLRLLGPGRWREEPIGSPRARVLLALLATEPAGVSDTRLAAELWPDDPPSNPTKALRVLVSRTRTHLPPDIIVRTATGYRLALDPDNTDLTYAARLAARANASLATGRPESSLVDAAAGLELWDEGEPDASVAEVLSGTAYDLGATRAALVRAKGLALQALGRNAEAVEALEPLLTGDADDGVRAAHLRALARSVSRAAAMERFETYRRDLRERLGASPGPLLREVQAELLDDTEPVRHGVRLEPNELVGRDADLAAIRTLIRRNRVTTIIGPGGLGKTRTAMALAADADERIVHVVELAGAAAGSEVTAEVAGVLGARDSRPRLSGSSARQPTDLVSAMVEQLGVAPCLLVLDNCEHVIESAAALTDVLIARTPRLKVLTTSRSPLDITAEAVFVLPQLDEPTSVELFRRRAQAVRPDVELDAEVVGRLCEQLDGLPLAIELAAARTRLLSVAEIERRLQDRFAVLRGTSRSAPARHQTLHAVIDWSWNLLGEDERKALRQLAIFQGGFTLDAAAAAYGTEVEGAVESLVAQSLLTVVETDHGSRYRMLETVRDFALARLTEAGEVEVATTALRHWAAEFTRTWGGALIGPNQFEAMDRLRAEEPNLVQALGYAVTDKDGDTVSSVFAALSGRWSIESNHLRVVEVAADVDSVLYHHNPSPRFALAHRGALVNLGVNAIIIQPRRAMRSISRLRRLPPSEPRTTIDALGELLVLMVKSTYPDIALLEQLSDDTPMAASLCAGMAAHLAENDGDLALALDYSTRALAAAESIADPWSLAGAHQRIAALALQIGDPRDADAHAVAALPTLERLGALPDVAHVRGIRVLAALHLGDSARAEELYEAVDSGPQTAGRFGVILLADILRAEIDLSVGRIDNGLYRFRRAVERSHEESLPQAVIDVKGLEPWTLHTEATCLAAHVIHDRVDDAPDGLAVSLVAKGRALMADTRDPFFDFPVAGAVLYGLGLWLLTPEGRLTAGLDAAVADEVGVRMLAIAAVFGHPRNHPSMSYERGRDLARAADAAAYDAAVEEYAALPKLASRVAASELLDRLPLEATFG